MSQPDAKRPRHSGRATGAANYSTEDLEALLNILETELLLGGHAWNSAADDFNNWAADNGQPSRTVKSLELKFKQVRHLNDVILFLLNASVACQDLKTNWRC